MLRVTLFRLAGLLFILATMLLAGSWLLRSRNVPALAPGRLTQAGHAWSMTELSDITLPLIPYGPASPICPDGEPGQSGGTVESMIRLLCPPDWPEQGLEYLHWTNEVGKNVCIVKKDLPFWQLRKLMREEAL